MDKKIIYSEETYVVEVPDMKDGVRYRVFNDTIINMKGDVIGKRKEEKKVRDLEHEMLMALTQVAYRDAKTMQDSCCLMDLFSVLKDADDNCKEVSIDERDIKSLVSAYESISGKRPTEWWRCRKLLTQLLG